MTNPYENDEFYRENRDHQTDTGGYPQNAPESPLNYPQNAPESPQSLGWSQPLPQQGTPPQHPSGAQEVQPRPTQVPSPPRQPGPQHTLVSSPAPQPPHQNVPGTGHQQQFHPGPHPGMPVYPVDNMMTDNMPPTHGNANGRTWVIGCLIVTIMVLATIAVALVVMAGKMPG